jgi:DNA-directed RNA polymerase subunit omega
MKLYAMKDLLQGENSRYKLVNMVAHRAREIAVDAEKEQVSLTEKPVTMALEEAADGQLVTAEEEAE